MGGFFNSVNKFALSDKIRTTFTIKNGAVSIDDSNTVFYVALEHGVPLLPNIRAQHFAMDVDGSNVLSRSIEFNGETFNLSEDINTAIDLQQSDAVLYYEVLDNYLSLDLGLAVSFIEGILREAATMSAITWPSFSRSTALSPPTTISSMTMRLDVVG